MGDDIFRLFDKCGTDRSRFTPIKSSPQFAQKIKFKRYFEPSSEVYSVKYSVKSVGKNFRFKNFNHFWPEKKYFRAKNIFTKTFLASERMFSGPKNSKIYWWTKISLKNHFSRRNFIFLLFLLFSLIWFPKRLAN